MLTRCICGDMESIVYAASYCALVYAASIMKPLHVQLHHSMSSQSWGLKWTRADDLCRSGLE